MHSWGHTPKFWLVRYLPENLLVGKFSSKSAKFGAKIHSGGNLWMELKFWAPCQKFVVSVGKLWVLAPPIFYPQFHWSQLQWPLKNCANGMSDMLTVLKSVLFQHPPIWQCVVCAQHASSVDERWVDDHMRCTGRSLLPGGGSLSVVSWLPECVGEWWPQWQWVSRSGCSTASHQQHVVTSGG